MTDFEINQMVALRLGWKIKKWRGSGKYWFAPGHDSPDIFLPKYCTDIKAAWEIVEKLVNDHCTVSLNMTWRFGKPAYQGSIYVGGAGEISDTAPMAICLAFLKIPKEPHV